MQGCSNPRGLKRSGVLGKPIEPVGRHSRPFEACLNAVVKTGDDRLQLAASAYALAFCELRTRHTHHGWRRSPALPAASENRFDSRHEDGMPSIGLGIILGFHLSADLQSQNHVTKCGVLERFFIRHLLQTSTRRRVAQESACKCTRWSGHASD